MLFFRVVAFRNRYNSPDLRWVFFLASLLACSSFRAAVAATLAGWCRRRSTGERKMLRWTVVLPLGSRFLTAVDLRVDT